MPALIVYRCFDNQEEESCFLVETDADAKAFLDGNPKPPEGYENRPGYYFFEHNDGVTSAPIKRIIV